MPPQPLLPAPALARHPAVCGLASCLLLRVHHPALPARAGAVQIGTAIAVESHVYPAIIGADIGCGVRLQALRVRARGQGERLARALHSYAPYIGTREVCPPGA
jgi:hypothetical protein